jgi:inositol oxygenase
MLNWVQKFNSHDLYSKSPVRPDWDRLRPYYAALIDRYLPGKLRW